MKLDELLHHVCSTLVAFSYGVLALALLRWAGALPWWMFP